MNAPEDNPADEQQPTKEEWEAMEARQARPTDIHGNPIEMGPWYWAKSRTGKIVGTGKFAVAIGGGEVTWFINGTGYDPANFTFVKSELPDFSFGITCEHGVKDADYCSACNRDYKAAREYEERTQAAEDAYDKRCRGNQ